MGRISFRASRERDGLWLKFSQGTHVDGDPEVVIAMAHSLYQPQGEIERLALASVLGKMPSAYEALTWQRGSGHSWVDLLLNHGRNFEAGHLPQEEFVRGFQEEDIRPWCCFHNAAKMARKNGFQYAEGFAVSPSGPMLHAWNIRNGQAIDYTWPVTSHNRYFGMVFDLDWLDQIGCPEGGVFYFWRKTEGFVREYLTEPRIDITHCFR